MTSHHFGTVGHADAKEVAQWSEGLPDRYLLCRDMGHRWQPFSARWDEKERAYSRVLRCSRCKTDRTQLLAMNGLILSGHYEYPDGYTAPAGTGRIDQMARGALRLESTLRLIQKEEGA